MPLFHICVSCHFHVYVVKLSFGEGAVNKTFKKLGVVCIAFYNEGQILAIVAKPEEGDSSLVAEVLAIEKAMDMALCYGWRRICFNSDSKIVINATKNLHNDHPWETYAPIQ